jgi:hypothetical protein
VRKISGETCSGIRITALFPTLISINGDAALLFFCSRITLENEGRGNCGTGFCCCNQTSDVVMDGFQYADVYASYRVY